MRGSVRLAAILALVLSPSILSAQTTTPVITPGGILSAAGLGAEPPNVAAPGSLVSIFGRNLANTTATASGAPLPRELNGTAVLVGNVFAPLLFISPTQINAQIPFEILPGSTAPVVVWVSGRASAPEPLRVEAAAPSLFTQEQTGVGTAVAFHVDSSLVSSESPAFPGEELSILVTGLGTTLASPTAPALVSGAPGNGQTTLLVPGVTIGSSFAAVTSSVAAPGGIGQYLIRVVIPIVTAGNQPVVVDIGGRRTAAPVAIPISTTAAPEDGRGFQFTQPPPLFQQTLLAGSFTANFDLKMNVSEALTVITTFTKPVAAPGCTINVTGLNGPSYEALVHCQDYKDPNNLIAIIIGLKGGQFANNKLVFTELQDTSISHFFFIGKSSKVADVPDNSIDLTMEAPIIAGAASIDFQRPDFAVGDTIIGTVHVTFRFAGSIKFPSQTAVLGGGFVDTITFVKR